MVRSVAAALLVAIAAPVGAQVPVAPAPAVEPQGRSVQQPAGQARAARATPPLDRLVSLDFRNARLEEVLDAIDKQARIRLQYTPRAVPVDKRVSIHVKGATVRAALTTLLQGADVEIVGTKDGEVMLVPREESGGNSVREDTTGTVVGRVRDSVTARPVKGVLVSIGGTALTATTNDSGAFWFAKVPAGMHQVMARMVGYMVAQREVVVQPGQTVGVELKLRMSMTRLQEVVTTATGPRRRMD
ncbi:MAG: carboxypeptidase regulatory-like domain-containing protein, partial [Gemmatimonadaceae bacterium]|nr:carboxypeptidase regulatory-like domain-containing protein [Gemmatimonadaceae bacterium]